MAAHPGDSANDNVADEMAVLIRALLAENPDTLDALGAGVLAASYLGLVSDTKTFARELGVGHALIIRAVTTLSSELGLVAVERHSERSQKMHYRLTESGRALVDGVGR
mgnify:CR=1 FL=1